MSWLNRFFKLEEINGSGNCPTYLYRWTLLRTPWFAVYLHHFVADDWSRDMHDHPKKFWSIGLWGSYIEETPEYRKFFHAPWIRSFPATHIHRLRLFPGRTCWTLVVVGKVVRKWGFWHLGKWIGWREYVRSEIASSSKNCSE